MSPPSPKPRGLSRLDLIAPIALALGLLAADYALIHAETPEARNKVVPASTQQAASDTELRAPAHPSRP